MAALSKYCCAYPAAQLRAFESWTEKVPPLQVTAGDEPDAGADQNEEDDSGAVPLEYFFVHDNFVVTASVYVDEQIAFDAVSDEWKRFCAERLIFDVPVDLDAAADQDEAPCTS
jgi:hypothetical protein